MILDAHAHIGRFHVYYDPLRIRTVEETVKVMDRFKVAKACVSSLYATHYDFTLGNEMLKADIKWFPDRFLPFCVVDPQYEGEAIDEARKCLGDWGWRGLKLGSMNGCPPYTVRVVSDSEQTQRVVDEASKYAVPVLIHPDSFRGAERLAELFPRVTFILPHAIATEEALDAARKHGNLMLETSETSMNAGVVERAVGKVGARRLLFGTNLPISYPGVEVARIMDAEISDRDKELILAGNLSRLLGVEP